MRPVDDPHAHDVGIGESLTEREREAHAHAHTDAHTHTDAQPQPVGQRVGEWPGIGQRQRNIVPLPNYHANTQSGHHHAQPHPPLIA